MPFNNKLNFPVLYSSKLKLRPFNFEDVARVAELINNPCIIKMFDPSGSRIPYPYSIKDARDFISRHIDDSPIKGVIAWGITLKEDNQIIGCIEARLNSEKRKSHLGYWIGEPYWNKGFCTEAMKSVIEYLFTKLDIDFIEAEHYSENLASGSVLTKY